MREPFRPLTAVAAPLPLENINTDAIIPSAWLRTAQADLGRGLFGAWRYDEQGRERPEFVLNREPFRRAGVLLAGENFGCGSSREAAVWALAQFGIRCVLAPSFADIFRENAFRNGLVAGIVDAETMRGLLDLAASHPEPVFGIDLAVATATGPDGRAWGFQIPESRREALIRGDDEIDATLRLLNDIEAFHRIARTTRPWLFPSAGEGVAP